MNETDVAEHGPRTLARAPLWLRVALAYAALIAAVYLPVAALGRTLSPEAYMPWGVTEHGPWGAPGRRPINTFNIDLGTPGYYEAPINRLVGALWRRGEPPHWNPYQGMGAPLTTQYSARSLFPYQVLEDLAPARWADLFLLGRLWVAAMLTFGFLRRLTATVEGAFVGGVFYALSGSMVWFVNLEQMANVAMALPGFLWACEGLARDARPRDVAAGGAATAMVLLGGQPETALYVLALGAAWVPWRAWRLRTLRPALTAGVGAAVLGGLLSSPLLLPFKAFEAASFHLHDPSRMHDVPSTPWAFAISMLTPSWSERPVAAVTTPITGVWDFLGGYTGVSLVALLVIVLPRWRFRNRAEALFLAGAALTIVSNNFGLWPGAALRHVPLFNMVFSSRWAGPVWCFAAACSAGLCVDALAAPEATELAPIEPSNPALKHLPRALQTALALSLVALYGMCIRRAPGLLSLIEYTGAPEFPPRLYMLPSRQLGMLVTLSALVATVLVARARKGGPETALALGAVAVAELWFAVPQGLAPLWAVARVGAPVACLVAAWPLLRGRRAVAIGCAVVAVILAAACDLTAPRGLPDRRDAYRPAPYVRFLQSHVGHQRVMAVDGVLAPNLASAFGLRDARYIVALALPEALMVSLNALQWHPPVIDGVLWFTGGPLTNRATRSGLAHVLARHRAYDAFGVRYIVAPRDTPIGRLGLLSGVRLVYHGEVDVYESPTALPRAWMVHAFEPAPRDIRQLSARLNDPTFDARTTALVETAALQSNPLAAPSTASFTRDDANALDLRVEASTAGVLVISDAWYGAWEATVDGEPATVLRVNGCMRGVPVPPGVHRVEMRYVDDGFSLGTSLAAIGAVVCLALARMTSWKRGASFTRP